MVHVVFSFGNGVPSDIEMEEISEFTDAPRQLATHREMNIILGRSGRWDRLGDRPPLETRTASFEG